VLSLFRKAVMAGLGVGAQGMDKFEELAREGELSQTECAKAVRTLISEAEKGSKKLEESGRRMAERFLEHLPIPTRSDIERLEKKIQDLSVQVERKGKA
jgi:polyhydroxyalkanoate synthesis regulator phasin